MEFACEQKEAEMDHLIPTKFPKLLLIKSKKKKRKPAIFQWATEWKWMDGEKKQTWTFPES